MRLLFSGLSVAVLSTLVQSLPAVVTFDAPGHVYTDKETPVARGGSVGAKFAIHDWRGRPTGHGGTFNADGTASLPKMPTGYYHLKSGDDDVSFAVVMEPESRVFDRNSFYGTDSAQSWVSRKGAFTCPWNNGDTYRTVSDLIWRSGLPHVRDRLSWSEVNKQPDRLDLSYYMYNADMLHARGITLSGMFHDCPEWAGRLKRLPSDLNATFKFCSQAAAAFGDRMGDWEFWNEPDVGFAPEPVWDYAAAMKAAYLGFKAGRPGITVLPGSLCHKPDSVYAHALFDNDVAKFCDVFNYHTYGPIASYPKRFATLRRFMERYGLGDHAVWMTESSTELEGHASKPGPRKGVKVHSPGQELVKAEFYPKSQIAFQMEGIARNYYFVFATFNERRGRKDWGVIRRDGTVKPEYSAISTMTRELVSAKLKGEINVGEGLRAYLFEQPDGSQTVAFWSVSPLDTQREGVVQSTPDFAKRISIPAADGVYRLSDLCGTRSAVAASNGTLNLEATRFPAYVAGLRGLSATIPARAPGKVNPYVPKADEDLSVIIRVDLNTNDFEIAWQKTCAVLKGDTGRMRLQVWNMGDTAKTGRIAVSSGTFSGLPDVISLGPRGTPPATFDCVFSPSDDGASDPKLIFTGIFGGKRSSRLVMPVRLEKRFLSSCEKVVLDCNSPKEWGKNTSADSFCATWDAAEQAIRFDVEWKNQNVDRWFYPVYKLKLPRENLTGADMIQFEVKSDQNKVENDFAASNLMLVFGDRPRAKTFLHYSAPLGSWEKRYVELANVDPLANVVAIRLGANPKGTRCSYWIRNLTILKKNNK